MPKRRANGEGNIRKRKDGRWEGRYTAGYDTNGKAITKNVLGRTQAEVKDRLRTAIEDSKKLDSVKAGSYTLEQWLKLWYSVYVEPQVRYSTREFYHNAIDHHTYNRLEAAYGSDIFAAGKLRGKLNVSAMRAEKSLYDHVIYDSENERKFAGELDISEKVAVYVKLPSSFFISTPVGHYNPDWAIAFTEGSVRHIFFVAETKGNTDSIELRGIENAKNECARRHFAAISNEEVVYEVVDSFEKLMQKVI